MKKIIAFSILLLISVFAHAQSGLYLRLQYWSNNLDIQWLYFQDSTIFRNPKYGITPVQANLEIETKKENVAKILQVSESKISLKWYNGIYEAFNIAFNNKDLSFFNAVACTKAAPFQQNTIDNKRYSGLVNFENLSKNIELFLGKDGHFRLDNKDSNTKEEGSYTIDQNSIVFKYQNGHERKALIHTFDN